MASFRHFQAAGVNYQESLPGPFRFRVKAVARRAGHIRDNGQPPPDQSVEES
jgi:hypothetical protein